MKGSNMKSDFTMRVMGIIVTLYFNVAQGQVNDPQGQQNPPQGGQFPTGEFFQTMGPMEPFPLESMRNFTEAFGEEIKMLTYNLTAYRTYNDEVHRQLTTPKVFDPQDLVDRLAREIEELLKTKVKAVEKLVKAAEDARKDHEYRKRLQLEYVNNKKLLSQEDLEMMGINSSSVLDIYTMINLTQDNLFNDVQINPNYSTIHVPTNVYDQAPVILNGIQWSKKLDPIFKQNRKETSDLRWQYYCSVDGFLRIFPGVKWPEKNVEDSVDMYDCRVRRWYIKAASSPKNMVILVDTSGSMKGRRRIITVKTIQKLLETLSDDDHFNIITYSDKPRYLDNCFSGTLMQANVQNKQRAVKLFKKLEMKDTGELNLALEEAFKLFKSEEKEGREHLCNKAIMVITDGPSETYKEIFEKHNWPNKRVRVFSFLVGREVKENRYAKWMACANKGYYTHISTLADVQESVQYYLRVLSRPMGMARRGGGHPRTPKWTPVYADYTTEVTQNLREGVGLVISVSMPVFDTSNSSATGGRLLGVMGTDIPIQEITNLVPKGKLGANAYTFMYTHHGYVLFHPNMKPMYHKIKGSTSAEKEFRPFFNTIDITEMEYAVDHEELHEFRQKLLNASKPGRIKLKVKVPYDRSVPYDRMNRVEVVNHWYYTASITGTPYKIAIALPSYSSKRSKLTLMVKKFDSVCAYVQNKQKQYEFAPWRYCGNNDILHSTGFDRKLKILDLYKCVKGKGNCSDQDSLLYSDLFVHHTMMRKTIGSHEDYRFQIANNLQTGSDYSTEPEYKKFYEKKGIELLFIATRGGLTDFVAPKETMISPYWMGNMTATIEELYYRQAIMNKEEKKIDYTFSIPLNKEYMEGDNMTILSTIPVYVNDSNIAVAGMMQNFSAFTDIFKKYLFCNNCRGPGCFTCERYGCYLLDENGYIVYGMEGVSKFLGDTEDLGLMAMLIKEGVFIRETYTDYQSECKETYDEETEEEGASSASLLFSPFKRLFDILLWSAVEFLITFTKVGLSGWFYSEKATAAPVNENLCLFLGPRNTTLENLQEQYQVFARAFYCNKEPENMHLVPCHMTKRAYHANFKVFRNRRGSVEGVSKGCVPFNCTKKFAAVWIRDTNLMLVSSDRNCNCSGVVDEVATMNGDPIVYNETESCELMQEISERVQVETRCIVQNPKEETTECGCWGLLASVPVLVLSVALTFWFSR